MALLRKHVYSREVMLHMLKRVASTAVISRTVLAHANVVTSSSEEQVFPCERDSFICSRSWQLSSGM